MILIRYANVPKEEQYTIEIDRIELGLMRVYEQNNLDTGVIVPVWDFYGKINGKSEGTYLTINAVDGSIIDRVGGY